MNLLLHICCGPCSVYPIDVLKGEGVNLTGFFYNPNIHPVEEFARRRDNVEMCSRLKGVDVEYCDDYMQKVWEELRLLADERCAMCYSLRLERTALQARNKGFEAFSTTLLVSPYQNHELIRELGRKFADKFNVEFFYRDFRPGFRQGQQQAKEMGLYRQKYCGCIISMNQTNNNKAGKNNK